MRKSGKKTRAAYRHVDTRHVQFLTRLSSSSFISIISLLFLHSKSRRLLFKMSELVNVVVAIAVIVFVVRWVTSGESPEEQRVRTALGFRPKNVTPEMVRFKPLPGLICTLICQCFAFSFCSLTDGLVVVCLTMTCGLPVQAETITSMFPDMPRSVA